jgi:hypothetical protein
MGKIINWVRSDAYSGKREQEVNYGSEEPFPPN